MERGGHPIHARDGTVEGLLEETPSSPGPEVAKIACSFCDRSFEVSRPREGGRIRGEVQCSHCARTGIVVYGAIGDRTLMADRRRQERRSARDRRQA